MKKKKIIGIILGCLLGAALLAAGIFVGIELYLDSQIHFVVQDTLPDGGGKKVTVILLGGQSNASGCSWDEYLKKNVPPEKYAEYEAGYDNVYINLFATGTNETRGFFPCTNRGGENGACFGPELGLAEKLHEMYPDRTFFIIKYAWGGSNLFDQWISPSGRPGKTGKFYRQFVKYVQTSLNYLESKNYDVTIEGMCWMQGESDAFDPYQADAYGAHLRSFIKDIRKEFSAYAAPDGIAFIDATIAANPAYWVYYEKVNAGKAAVAAEDPMVRLIDTNAHGLTCSEEPADNPDLAHYDSMSQLKLGHLFAAELANFMN